MNNVLDKNDITLVDFKKKMLYLRKEYMGLRFQKSTQELENTSLLKSKRKEIARLLTFFKNRG